MTCCLWHSGRVIVTFRVKYDISGELLRHTGLTVTYWVTVTYCGPTTLSHLPLCWVMRREIVQIASISRLPNALTPPVTNQPSTFSRHNMKYHNYKQFSDSYVFSSCTLDLRYAHIISLPKINPSRPDRSNNSFSIRKYLKNIEAQASRTDSKYR